MPSRRLIVTLVLMGLIGLTPLAWVTVPTRTWQAGVCDDADVEDVILAVLANGAFAALLVERPGRSAPAVREAIARFHPVVGLVPLGGRPPPT